MCYVNAKRHSYKGTEKPCCSLSVSAERSEPRWRSGARRRPSAAQGGGGDHAAAAAAVLWEPLSGGVAAVTTQRVSVRCHRRPGGNRMKEALPPGSSPRGSRRRDVLLKRPTAQREVLRSPVYIS